MNKKTEAKAQLEVKAAFSYMLSLLFISGVAVIFQIIGNVDFAGIARPMVIFILDVVLAFIIYKKKKNGQNPVVLMWIVAMISVILPLVGKINYAANAGFTPEAWTFALESYNSSVLLIAFLLALQLLYNKPVLIGASALAIVGWSVFLIVAVNSGAEYYIEGMKDGVLNHGFIILREIFFILIGAFMAYLSYRNIPVIEDYDTQVAKHTYSLEVQKEQLEAMINTIEQLSAELAQMATGVSDSTKMISRNASSQAANLEEIVSSLEEMSASVQNNTDNTKETNILVQKTYKETHEAIAIIEKTKSAMQEMADKIHFIEEIAFQTNLLSLNASVEAARAGEYGRGFVVVATEVRRLAERSQNAVKEISEVSTASMNVAQQMIDLFGEIVPNIKTSSTLMGEVANASIEQNEGLKQINTGMDQLNQLTQNNAASSEELAALAEKLHEQSNILMNLVENKG